MTVAKVRVYELAEEFGVENSTVIATLQEMGAPVRSASSTVDARVVRRLKEELAGQAAADAPAGPGTTDRRDTERPYEAFGQAIRAARSWEGLSRADTADRLGISYPMLANIESGRRRVSDELLAKLAPILGVSVEELRLLRDAGTEHAPPDIADRLRSAGSTEAGVYTRSLHSRYEDHASVAQRLAEHQELNALASAGTPLSSGGHAGRTGQLSALLRDLRELDSAGIDKAHAFVRGLLTAQEREATALDPESSIPLIRVQAHPFGPRQRWTAPAWMRDLAAAGQAWEKGLSYRQAVALSPGTFRVTGINESHMLGIGGFKSIAEQFRTSLAARELRPEQEIPNADELTAAAYIGAALASPLRSPERSAYMYTGPSTTQGFVDAYTWLAFVAYQTPAAEEQQTGTATSLWLTRITFIGTVTRQHLAAFIDECLQHTDESGGDWNSLSQAASES